MFEKFYELDQSEIVNLVKTYLEENLFSTNPELKSDMSVAISGSIALGYYDAYSDIDLDFYCNSPEQVAKHKDKIVEFKQKVTQDKTVPIQVHSLKDLETISNDLSSWTKDHSLREMNRSLNVRDPRGSLTALQKKFSKYPEGVCHEKIQWLFAQLVFQYEEHFKPAIKRGDNYFTEVSKISIIRLSGNLLLVANKQWIAFDKHLFKTLNNTGCDPEVLEIIYQVIDSSGISNTKAVESLMRVLENNLIDKNAIKKETTKYWIDMRPRYSVELL